MKMTEFCDHLYDESTDGYIQILKLDDKNNRERPATVSVQTFMDRRKSTI